MAWWKPLATSASSRGALLPCLGILSRRAATRRPPVAGMRLPSLPDTDTLFFFIFSGLAREELLLQWRRYRSSREALSVQIYCSHLEHCVGFPGPRCSSSAGIFAVPSSLQLCGATSLRRGVPTSMEKASDV